MELVAQKLKTEAAIESRLISQTQLPEQLKSFATIVVYIHRELGAKAERAFIDYANGGGKLLLLHHSISSGKRKNVHWFSFLGVALPEGDLAHGGYKWIEGVSFELVNLNPNHFIMTNNVKYPEKLQYARANHPAGRVDAEGFRLADSEVYLNHQHTGPRTLLMGFRYVDPKTGVHYEQERAGWLKEAGKGLIIYLMPGHTRQDFEDPTYSRIVLNAVIYQRQPAGP